MGNYPPIIPYVIGVNQSGCWMAGPYLKNHAKGNGMLPQDKDPKKCGRNKEV